MFGMLYSTISGISLGYPFYRSIKLLETLFNASNRNTVAALTDTVPLGHGDVVKIQETMSYWMVLALFSTLLQTTPVKILLKVLPFSSVLVLYVQVWLGFPIASLPHTPARVSGAHIIYHYYFDNNMRNLNKAKTRLFGHYGVLGRFFCRLLHQIPSIDRICWLAGIDLKALDEHFNSFCSPNKLEGGVAPSSGTVETLQNMFYAFTSTMYGETNGQADPTTGEVGIAKTVFWSLCSPFGYSGNASLQTYATNPTMSRDMDRPLHKTPSPARSFDDFAIVSSTGFTEDDTNETVESTSSRTLNVSSQSQINVTKRNTKSETHSKITHPDDSDERTGLLGGIKRVGSNTLSKSISGSRSSSWFKSK